MEGLHIHDLRHTAVALGIAAGAGPKEVAARAGHTSVSTTGENDVAGSVAATVMNVAEGEPVYDGHLPR